METLKARRARSEVFWTEKSQINNHIKLLEKQEQAKPKTSRRREKIKISTKINEI
jgi:hypothetical protein